MIQLKRVRTSNSVHKKYTGSDKEKADYILLVAYLEWLNDNQKKINFDSSYWKNSKTQLKKETYQKCAYCEANTQVVAHGDVEHYRPKSEYWWLAYTYDNYLYSCQICNQIHKKDHFPIVGKKLSSPQVLNTHTLTDIKSKFVGKISPDPLNVSSNYTLSKLLTNHKKEKPLLINPYIENPEVYFSYQYDDVLKEVKIIASKPKYQAHIESCEKYYGINRIELKNFRYSVFVNFRIIKKMYNKLVIDKSDVIFENELKKQISEMISDKYLFAGMNRYFNKIL